MPGELKLDANFAVPSARWGRSLAAWKRSKLLPYMTTVSK